MSFVNDVGGRPARTDEVVEEDPTDEGGAEEAEAGADIEGTGKGNQRPETRSVQITPVYPLYTV